MGLAPSVRSLERLLNAISVIALGYVLVMGAKRWMSARPSQIPSASLRVGQAVAIPTIDWRGSDRNVLFVLSTTCRFCMESSAFYRDLLDRRNDTWRPYAMFAQEADAARAYMAEQGYEIDALRQTLPGSMGALSTPQILLVDRNGILQQQWIGKLLPVDERDVAEHLGVTDLPKRTHAEPMEGNLRTATSLIDRSSLRDLLASNADVSVVDVRERTRYQHGHIKGAINLPWDELQIRARQEIRQDVPLLLYCNYSASCEANGIPSRCTLATDQLQALGYSQIGIIRDPLSLLGAGRVAIEGIASELPGVI